MHLVIDGHNGDRQRLQDPDVVHRFLDEYPDALGMTKITPPHVYTYHGPQPGDWGVSGFVLIAESHISVHTFPDRGYVNIDVFSCKEFNPAPRPGADHGHIRHRRGEALGPGAGPRICRHRHGVRRDGTGPGSVGGGKRLTGRFSAASRRRPVNGKERRRRGLRLSLIVAPHPPSNAGRSS